jgi:hypothetical protein
MRPHLALLLAALPLATFAAPVMKPGEWTLVMTVFGDGTRKPPRPDGACTLSNVQRTDDAASYDLACLNGAIQAQGRATLHYQPEKYEGSVMMSMTEHGAPARMTALRIYARRTGECTK